MINAQIIENRHTGPIIATWKKGDDDRKSIAQFTFPAGSHIPIVSDAEMGKAQIEHAQVEAILAEKHNRIYFEGDTAHLVFCDAKGERVSFDKAVK